METHYVKNGEPSSEQEIIRQTFRVLSEHYGLTAAEELGPLKLQAVRRAMIQRGWCRESINQRVGRIRRMFKWAVSQELVAESVWQRLNSVAGLQKGRTEAKESAPVAPVDEATVNATLPHLPQTIADMVRLQILTGCRPGEICSVRPCDSDRSGDVWEYRPESHKNEHRGKDRQIYFGPKAQAILLRYPDNRPAEEHCFSPASSEATRNKIRWARRKTPMTPSQSARRPKRTRKLQDRYTKDTYRRAISRACEKAFGMLE